MALPQPDILTHNNQDLPIVHASDVGGGYMSKNSILERDAIPIAKRGRLVDVLGDKLYKYTYATFEDEHWTNTSNWQEVGKTTEALHRSHSFIDLSVGYKHLLTPTLINEGIVTPYVYADNTILYRYETEDGLQDAFYKKFSNNVVSDFIISRKLTNTYPIVNEISNIIIGSGNFRLIKRPGNTNPHLEVNDLISEGFLSNTIFIKKAQYTNALGDGDVTNFGNEENDYEDGNYAKVETIKYN